MQFRTMHNLEKLFIVFIVYCLILQLLIILSIKQLQNSFILIDYTFLVQDLCEYAGYFNN